MIHRKIGILTCWSSSDNYGQQLQCYALQHYLRGLGHDAYLVKFVLQIPKSNIAIRIVHRVVGSIKSLLNPSQRRLSEIENTLYKENLIKNKQRKFVEFRSEYIKSTDREYHTIEELRANPPEADMFICGSDQVWHDPLSNPNNAAWYLQFGDKSIKRISYAASIGRDIEQGEEKLFKQYLASFDSISVREIKAMEYCHSIGFCDTVMVCDPTLLLPVEEFPVEHKTVYDKPYVFVYTLNIKTSDELYWDTLKTYIENSGLEVKAVGSSGYYPARDIIPGIENIQATIPQWLSLIQNASLVVTSSFHGVVFCIKMHRPFVAIPLTGKYKRANDRLVSLLSGIGLEHHICYAPSDVQKIADETIDWNFVDNKLMELSASGIDFLKNNI